MGFPRQEYWRGVLCLLRSFPWKVVNRNTQQLDLRRRPAGRFLWQCLIWATREAFHCHLLAEGCCGPVAKSDRDSMNCASRLHGPSPSPGNLLRSTSTELVLPSNHLILCRPLLLLPSIFPSIRVFSNEWARHIKLSRVATRKGIYNAHQVIRWTALRGEQSKTYTTVQISWNQTWRSSWSNSTGKWHPSEAERARPTNMRSECGTEQGGSRRRWPYALSCISSSQQPWAPSRPRLVPFWRKKSWLQIFASLKSEP